MTGKRPVELNYTEPVDDVCYLLNHFYTIKKSYGQRITYSELSAYNDLMACRFESWEVACIMTIDTIFEGSVNV